MGKENDTVRGLFSIVYAYQFPNGEGKQLWKEQIIMS